MNSVQLGQLLFSLFITFNHQVNGDIYSSFELLSDLSASIPLLLKIVQDQKTSEDLFETTKENLLLSLEELQEDINGYNSSEEFVSNPINSFHLIKKCKEVKNFLNKINFTNEDHHLDLISILPDGEDYHGSIQSINRIAETYSIEPHDFRVGLFLSKYKSRPLTALECFDFARIAFQDKNKFLAYKWLNESLEVLKLEGKNSTIEKHKIIELLALTHEHYGQIIQAYDLINECLIDQPGNPTYLAHLNRYEDFLQDPSSITMDNTEIFRELSHQDEKYYNLCKQSHSIEIPNNLTCKYKSDHPFFVIGPIKEEQVSIDPEISIFYDFITDSHVNIMKNFCKKKYSRFGHKLPNGTFIKYDYRIAQVCSLYDKDHKSLSYLSELIKSITKLSTEYAETWQVSNYGTGGHYKPHFDFYKDQNRMIGLGNRLATLLIYIDLPEGGGATVFPELNIKVPSVKKSAIFWYNLMNDGKGDERTLNGACPVVYGKKIISNRMIREYGNEFARPCKPFK